MWVCDANIHMPAVSFYFVAKIRNVRERTKKSKSSHKKWDPHAHLLFLFIFAFFWLWRRNECSSRTRGERKKEKCFASCMRFSFSFFVSFYCFTEVWSGDEHSNESWVIMTIKWMICCVSRFPCEKFQYANKLLKFLLQ